jgi:uncharacterized protein YndB with AHSA1/START domain
MRYSDGPTVEHSVYIDAPPERVWPLVIDPAVVTEVSPELRGIEWLDGATGPAVGNRFRGRNYHQAMGEWETTNTVVACTEPVEFAWAVSDVDNPSSTWRFTLRPDGAGTTLRQWMRMGPARSGLNFAIDRWPEKEERIVARRQQELRSAMELNLAEFKRRSEER